MTEILPVEISSTDVASLLEELAVATPYSDDNWQTASIDFKAVNLTVNIRVRERKFSDIARNRIALVIQLLPEFQLTVIKTMTRLSNGAGNDQHELSWIDIDFDNDNVDLCYNGITYNTQWNQAFAVSQTGNWHIVDLGS